MLTPDPSTAEPRTPEAGAPQVPDGVAISGGPPSTTAGYDVPVTPLTPVATRRPSFISGVHLALGVVALLAGAALFLSGYSLGRQAETTPGTPATEQQAFVPFWDAYRAITEQYAGGTVVRKTVIEGAIKGMIDSLGDPFSAYLSSEDYKKSLLGLSGQFEGIGANIGARASDGSGATCTPLGPTCQMVVLSLVDGSPADKAALRPGDVITKIDGVSVDGSTVNDAVAKVRGPKGTTIVLTVIHKGEAATDVPIVRDVISATEVISRSLANGAVGYIKMTGFSDNAANDLTRFLREDVDAGQRRIILDLRGNLGGFVTAARKVASQFIGSGPIYWQEDAQGTQLPTNAEPGGVATDGGIKLIVLIDKASASASEIVAGALQDTKRATLVGQVSYGKGTIQEWMPLPDDTGGFRLTIAKWLTPDKRWIHGTGLTPDVAVEIPASTPPEQDLVLDKALELLGAPTAGVLQLAA
jgi:carboxyl-terminal processing protease